MERTPGLRGLSTGERCLCTAALALGIYFSWKVEDTISQKNRDQKFRDVTNTVMRQIESEWWNLGVIEFNDNDEVEGEISIYRDVNNVIVVHINKVSWKASWDERKKINSIYRALLAWTKNKGKKNFSIDPLDTQK